MRREIGSNCAVEKFLGKEPFESDSGGCNSTGQEGVEGLLRCF